MPPKPETLLALSHSTGSGESLGVLGAAALLERSRQNLPLETQGAANATALGRRKRIATTNSGAWLASRIWPLAEPSPELAVVREVAQFELTRFVNDVPPSGTAVLLGGLFRVVLCYPANGCVHTHPAVDRPFSEGLSQRTDNTCERPMDLPIRRDAVDHELMELGRVNQLRKGFRSLRNICRKCTQPLKLAVDLSVGTAECSLCLQASFDSLDIVLLDEVVNEHVPEVHQFAQVGLQRCMGLLWKL